MKVRTADRISQIKEYYFSKKLREIATLQKSGINIINLGIGSPDQQPPTSVINKLTEKAVLDHHHGYQSYVGIPSLRNALTNWYQSHFEVSLDSDNEILPLIGSKEGIMHISMTYLQAGDEVLIPDPGYPSYASAARLAGAKVRSYDLTEEKGWLPDLNNLAQTDLSKVKLMWINYPHMPTGTRANFDQLREMVSFCRKYGILLCHDNPYAFILNEKPLSLFQVPGAKEIGLELTSLSKTYNMAGWRVGFLVAHADRIKEVLKFKSNMDSGMFKPIQLAAIEALTQDHNWFERLNETYHARRVLAEAILEDLECSYDGAQVGMFLWAKIPDGYSDGYAFSDLILDKARVFITPGNIFGENGAKYVRISLCSNMKTLQEARDRCQGLFTIPQKLV